MNARFDQPVWLWVAAVAIPLALIALRWFGAMSPARRWSAVILRAALFALIAALLAGLSAVQQGDSFAVVALADTSASVRRFWRPTPATDTSPTTIAEYLDRAARRRRPDDLLGVIAFDAQATAAALPTRAPPPQAITGAELQGTNIAGAIRLARATIPPATPARLLLLSDGNQTAGDALAAALESPPGQAPTPIDVVPLRYRLDPEVVLETLDAPAAATADAVVTLRVALRATAPGAGTLQLLVNGAPVDINGPAPGTGRPVTLRAGLNVVPLDIKLDPGRLHRFRASFEPDADASGRTLGDTAADNNAGEAFTITPGRGSVLIVSGAPDSTLARTLREAGAEVVVLAPRGFPPDLLALEAFDLIILDNVAATDLPPSAESLLLTYVTDLGGGLVMAGGLNAFAPGGWRGSTLEPILPVLLDVPDQVIASRAATLFILDNSGSMSRNVLGTGRTQQEIANDAAALALRSLDPADFVGVVTFNSDSDLLIPLGPNADSRRTSEIVRAIPSGGGTNMPPALRIAIDEFRRAAPDVKTKHVVILSDGASRGRTELPGLVSRLAADGVMVSAVGVGDGADLETLRLLADTGGGDFFHATNATQLPRLLLKAVRVVRTPLIRETPFTPVVTAPASPFVQGLADLPPLGGLVLTRARPEPTITTALAAPDAPVLAHWQVGLGQVVAWTSDTRDWAADWIASPAYSTLWGRILRVAARAAAPQGFTGGASIVGDEVVLRLESSDPNTGSVSVQARVYAPSGAATDAPLTQVGPGVYEARVPADETGSYIAVLKPRRGDAALAPLLVGATLPEGAETHSFASNDDLLIAIARATGGRVLEFDAAEPPALFLREGVPPRESVAPLTRPLLMWTLAVLLLDIATRRIAWDRWTSPAFRPALALPGAARTGDLLRARATPSTAPAIALGESDARDLALAARDRRRAQRLGETPPPAPPEKTAAETSALLSAKRRALDTFKDDPMP